MTATNEMNLTEGPLLKKLILYALPLLATNLLQLVFNLADVTVLGWFLDESIRDVAVSAVSNNGSLINLIVGLFIGMSVGANVMVARAMGENDIERARRIVGTSIVFSIIASGFLTVVGFFGARTFLTWMGCTPDIIDYATKYMQIYFLGMPAILTYNFCASILRAVGDTKRPLYFLLLGGVINVGLNIFLVAVVGMDVDGVAIATVMSQVLSCVLSLIVLIKNDGFAKLTMKNFKLKRKEFEEIALIGLPAGLQSCVFSISNVLIQGTVYSLDAQAVLNGAKPGSISGGNGYAATIDGFIYYAMYSFALAALSFVGQNLGAKKIDRVRSVTRLSLVVTTIVGIVVSTLVLIFAEPLCRLIGATNDSINAALVRLFVIGSTYFLCGIMDVMSSVMRGLGRSTTAMIVSLSGSCLFRIIWLNTIYLLNPCLEMVYVAYPISYVLTNAIYFIMYFPIIKKVSKQVEQELAESTATV